MKKILLDITNDQCPMTFVKTKLELARLAKDDQLLILVAAGEPANNLPKSLKNDGYPVISNTKINETTYLIITQNK